MKLSVVSTMYRSAPFVAEFYRRATKAASELTPDYELLLVNDGSPDDSLQRALAIAAQDDRVTVVDLSRNFGHHHAIVAGLTHARGERIFLIDIDLEEQPEWLADFAAEQERTQADVVFGVQQRRVGGLKGRYLGGLFYTMFNAISEIQIPESLCTVRIITRPFVDALLTLRDKNLFLAGNFAWVGFTQVPKVVQKTPRASRSTYNLSRSIRLLFDGVSSFSSYPLRAIFVTGLIISIVSGLVGLQMIVYKLMAPETVLLGFSAIMVSIWFLGGLTIFFAGVIGLYLSKVFNEVKERPQFIVRSVYRGRRQSAASARALVSESTTSWIGA